MAYGHSGSLAAMEADKTGAVGPVFTELKSYYGLFASEAAYATTYAHMEEALGVIANKLFLGVLLPGTLEGQDERNEKAVADLERLNAEISGLIGARAVEVTTVIPGYSPVDIEPALSEENEVYLLAA